MTAQNDLAQYARRRNLEVPNGGGGGLANSATSVDAKVVVMGNAGVGKTSLVCRYTNGTFSPAATTSTTGATFQAKKTTVDGVTVRLQLWDTAGQERFRSMAPMYYRGAHAAIVVYDITDLDSFRDLKSWLEELKKNTATDAADMIIYIVGSKADLVDQRAVTQDRARALLKQWFPPPQPHPPPPTPSNLASYHIPGYPFTSTSSIYPHLSSALTHSISSTISNSMSIPQQLSTLSTQLPTLPSFNIPRPRFPSLPSSKVLNSALSPPVEEDSPILGMNSTPGTSATSQNTVLTSLTGHTSTNSSSNLLYGPSTSNPNLLLPSPPPSASSRATSPPPPVFGSSAPPAMSAQGLNVNMSGSGYSGFSTGQGYGCNSSSSSVYATPSSSKVTDQGKGGKHRPVRRNTSTAIPTKGALLSPTKDLTRAHSSQGTPGSVIKPRPRRANGDDGDSESESSGASRTRASSRPAFRGGFSAGADQRDDEMGVGYFSDDNRHHTPSSKPVLTIRPQSQPFPPMVVRKDCGDDSVAEDLEEDEDVVVEEELAYGFSKEMRLFEVSSKDGNGINDLFVVLLQAVIKRRHAIETERRMRERDSVVLESHKPSWGAIAAANEDVKGIGTKKKGGRGGLWGWGGGGGACCGV